MSIRRVSNLLSELILILKRSPIAYPPATPSDGYQVGQTPAPPEAELEFMWRAFTNLNDWVRFSDTKAAAVLAADGVIVGSIATWLAGSHADLLKSSLAIGWLGLILVAAFYSAAYALGSLVPNLFAVKGKLRTSEEGSSLVFFADIARNFPTPKEFLATLRQSLADPDKAVAEISQQVWANSKVAASKYAFVTRAIIGLACGVYLGFVGIIILAVIKLSKSL